MHIRHDPSWRAYTARVQQHELARLDAVLLDNGVADPLVRQRIGEQFLHMQATFYDSGWLADGERTLYPVLGFAESVHRGERSQDWRLLVPPPHAGTSFMELATERAFLFRELEQLSSDWDRVFNESVPLEVGTVTSDVREVGATRSSGKPLGSK